MPRWVSPFNDTFSNSQIINAGCPQGSVLGPLLALMHLNGLAERTKNDILLFADDTSLCASHMTDDFEDVQLSLQHDVDEIYKYGREWAITFNTSKTVQQTFSHRQQYTLHTTYPYIWGRPSTHSRQPHSPGYDILKRPTLPPSHQHNMQQSTQNAQSTIPYCTVHTLSHSRPNLQNIHQTSL